MPDMRLDSTSIPVHEMVGLRPRAPRVAVVFDGGEGWHFWARAAMCQVTQCWAGAGFILVPHHGGRVEPVVAEWVCAYDPDFVVTATQTWAQRESVSPGFTAAALNRPVDDSQVVTLAQSSELVPQPDAECARDWLARRCTPYFRLDDGWEDNRQHLSGGMDSQIPLLKEVTSAHPLSRAVPSGWGGSVATAAAATIGVLDSPQSAATSTGDDPAVLAHLLDVHYGAPPVNLVHATSGIQMSLDPRTVPSALQATTHGLVWVSRRGTERRQQWVLGSTADDFAVAMAMNRLHRDTSWVDPAWFADEKLHLVLRLGAASAVSRRDQQALTLASVGLSGSALADWGAQLGLATPPVVSEVGVRAPATGIAVRKGRSAYHLAVDGQHDRSHSLPLVTDSAGTVKLASRPPLPTVEPGHALDTGRVPVQVDMDIPGAFMPLGRGMDAHAFAGEGDEQFHTWVRTSRTGLAYQSIRFDWISAGASSYGRLAQPLLGVPGLGPWVEQMAGQAGYGARASDAGRAAGILASLWGGREAMTAAVASPFRAALANFTPPRQRKDSYLAGEAVRITSDRGVLTFQGLRSHWGQDVGELTIRAFIDELNHIRVLRRGLVLRCLDCLTLDFYPVEDLAQQMTCARCGGGVSLVQKSWNKPEDEPRWFYDAHPLARGLVTTNSDVPLLLAAHLAGQARRCVHVGELELLEGTRSVAETDLITLADEVLSVAEAKSNTKLANGGQLKVAIDKRIRVANVLRADQVILATTEQAWPPSTVEAALSAIAAADWAARAPVLRLITGLRSGTIGDTTV